MRRLGATPDQIKGALVLGALPLPKVSMWTAWNEPNNPIFLAPQWAKINKTHYTNTSLAGSFNPATPSELLYDGTTPDATPARPAHER